MRPLLLVAALALLAAGGAQQVAAFNRADLSTRSVSASVVADTTAYAGIVLLTSGGCTGHTTLVLGSTTCSYQIWNKLGKTETYSVTETGGDASNVVSEAWYNGGVAAPGAATYLNLTVAACATCTNSPAYAVALDIKATNAHHLDLDKPMTVTITWGA